MIYHEDLDRVAAEALVRAGVAAVVNAAPSISGRYPNLGPKILEEAGIPLVDTVGPLLLAEDPGGRTPSASRATGSSPATGCSPSVPGKTETRSFGTWTPRVKRSTSASRASRATRSSTCARSATCCSAAPVSPSSTTLSRAGHALVVVRGYGYREDLAALGSYIRDVKPVLVGVDGGADALLDAGYSPDVVIGDMDSVSDQALS